MFSEKTLDIIVAAGIILLIALGVGLLMAWGLNKTLGSGDNQQQELKKDATGRWIVPAKNQPKDFEQLEEAPAINLFPGRVEEPPSAKESAERGALVKAVEGFLPRWESFNPQANLAAEERGRKSPYAQKLAPWISPRAAENIIERVDVSEWPGVCPTCRWGQKWLSAGQIASKLRINEISSNRAYLSITGIIMVEDQGTMIARNYGLLLAKQGTKWQVIRAVADRGQRL
jgi:hypothetical protein